MPGPLEDELLLTGLAQVLHQKQMVAEWNKDHSNWDYLFKLPTENSKMEQELRAMLKDATLRLNEGGVALDAEEGGAMLLQQEQARMALAGLKEAKKKKRAEEKEARQKKAAEKKEQREVAKAQKEQERRAELEAALATARIKMTAANNDARACKPRLLKVEVVALLHAHDAVIDEKQKVEQLLDQLVVFVDNVVPLALPAPMELDQ